MPATQNLTSAQAATLATDIAANTNTVVYDANDGQGPQTVQIKNTPVIGIVDDAIAAWYNLLTTVDFFGNYSKVPLSTIVGAIAWKKLTPIDAIPTTPSLSVELWTARSNASRHPSPASPRAFATFAC